MLCQMKPYRSPGLSISKVQLCLQGTSWEGLSLEPMPDKGLAHIHIRLLASGQLLRIPKQSQLGLDPQAHLEYETACFQLASRSGVTPVLRHVLPVCDSLPRGALIVDAIDGEPACLPRDLLAVCRSLAAIHRVPYRPALAPELYAPQDPLRGMVEEIDQQTRYLDTSTASRETLCLLRAQLEWAHDGVFSTPRPPCTLITFDAHPGNFLVGSHGTAWMVDLEKCRFSYPGFDLAHATLYTSTTWDVQSCAVLSIEDVVQAYQTWESHMIHGSEHRAWHVPLRRLMWLWSTTWCAKWLALSSEKKSMAGAQDWSDSHNEPALNRHVRERARHYLEPSVVLHTIAELNELKRAFS